MDNRGKIAVSPDSRDTDAYGYAVGNVTDTKDDCPKGADSCETGDKDCPTGDPCETGENRGPPVVDRPEVVSNIADEDSPGDFRLTGDDCLNGVDRRR